MPGAGEGAWELGFTGDSFHGEDEKVLEMDGSDGYTTKGMS